MRVEPLDIEGAWMFTPVVHGDARGSFLEWFRADLLAAEAGHAFELAQANCSVSNAGTLRGIHFAELPPSQAKYVTCVSGAVLDVTVDLRVGSPTFGRWASVELDDVTRRAVYLSEGLGHAFLALTEPAVVAYLCSAPYAPGREHGIHPMDPDLAVAWPANGPDGRPLEPLLSDKDAAAPTLAEVAATGLLPTYAECRAFRDGLSRR